MTDVWSKLLLHLYTSRVLKNAEVIYCTLLCHPILRDKPSDMTKRCDLKFVFDDVEKHIDSFWCSKTPILMLKRTDSGVKVVLSLALVCCYQSPQIGCDFVTVNYINFLWRPLAIFRSGIFHCGASRNLNRFNFPDHIPSWLRSSRSYLRSIFLDPLSPSNKEFALSFFFLEFFLAQKSSFDGAPRRGEGRVNGYQGYA